MHTLILKTTQLPTPLGPMVAISDETALYLLEFMGAKNLEKKLKKLQTYTRAPLRPGRTRPLDTLEQELEAYFKGTQQAFRTPFHLLGTPFQKKVWTALGSIPYGQTSNYATQALLIGAPSAYRALANANGANQLAIIIPCHRVVHANGTLGGYGGGVARKKTLLQHEQTGKCCYTDGA